MMKTHPAQCLTVIALALAGPAAAAEPAVSAAEAAFAPFATLRLIDGVRVMMTPPDYTAFTSSNVTIVEQADGLVVVDSGADRGDGDAIVRYIRSYTAKPVKALVLTHWHNDHIQGASRIAAAWPKLRIIATAGTRAGIDGPAGSEGLGYGENATAVAKIVGQLKAAIADADRLGADPKASDWQRLRYARMAREYRAGIPAFTGTRFVRPTEALVDEIVIPDPLRPVHVRFLGRANTAGDAIVWLPNQRLVATGDVVVAPIPFGFGSYPADWIATLGKVRALGFEVLVPGHGLPQQDASYLDRLVASITALRTQVGVLAAQGLTLAQVRERLDLSGLSQPFGETARRQGAVAAMWLTPMIENTWKEAKGIAIVQGEGELPN